MASIRLGDLLVKAKVINESQLKAALAEQQKWGGKLGEILVRMNFVTEEMLVKALSKQLTIQTVALDTIQSVPAHVRAKVPAAVARDLVVLPLQLRDEGKTLVVAMAEPQNLKHLDTLRSVTRCRIVPQLAGRHVIAKAFSRFYEGEAELGDGGDEELKLVDSQGHTLIKHTEDVQPPVKRLSAPAQAAQAAQAAAAAAGPPVLRRVPTQGEVPSAPAGAARTPAEQLKAIEEAQRKEVAALKALVEVLIAKGVFTREEYVARVKR